MSQLQRIPLTQIAVPDAPPPTKSFVRSLKAHGQIMPIVLVEEETNWYRVVAGKRRVLAAEKAGLDSVEALVIPADDKQEAIIRLLENMQRSPNAADEASAMQILLQQGMAPETIAAELGLSRAKVYQRLMLIEKLIPALFAKLQDGTLSARAGALACTLPEEIQKELATRDKISISEVQALKRSRQLQLLDVDEIDIPFPNAKEEQATLATRLSEIAYQMAPDWRKQALIAAVRALMVGESETEQATTTSNRASS